MKTRKEKVIKYLNEFGSITRAEAEYALGLNKAQFWSAISQLRKEGVYIVIHRNRLEPINTIYALESEEQRLIDQSQPHYCLTTEPRLWEVWRHMRERCNYSKHKSYKHYGGRGIKVCDEWDKSFEAFAKWAYANGYNKDAPYMECTLDRIDSDGDYEPSNCRWATIKEQCNNRRSNLRIAYKGETKTLCEWADELHIPRDTLSFRLRNGWGVNRAFNTPVKKRKNNKPTTWTA